MHLIVIGLCLVLFAVLTGVAVRCALRAEAEEGAGDVDVIARVMRGGAARKGRGRHLRLVREGLPDSLDMIANSLTAGLTLPQAILRNIEHFPPDVGAEFARILYDTSLGFSIAGAFDNFAGRLGTKDAQMIAVAAKIGTTHGGKLHENYRMLADILRDGLAFENELRAMTTEGRMQAIVMSCLPVALMLILGTVNPPMMKPLFTTIFGWLTLAALATMQGIAYLWIRRIVDIEI